MVDADVREIVAWRPAAVLTLVTASELHKHGTKDLAAELAGHAIAWVHIPIEDFQAPDASFDAAWVTRGPALLTHLTDGRNVLVHCRGGHGRCGTVAARLLIDAGHDPDTAIAMVRAARPGAIETAGQEAYLRAHDPEPPR